MDEELAGLMETNLNIKTCKDVCRQRVWSTLQASRNLHPYPPECHGRIPYFLGSERAASRLASLWEFQHAQTVKVNPSLAQMEVRKAVLKEGKTLVVPAPALSPDHPNGGGDFMFKLRGEKGSQFQKACTKKGAAKYGTPLGLDHGWDGVGVIDLYVVGSVAVTPEGVRLGKGLGYAEMEWAILYKMGKVDPNITVVATTVEDLQVVDPEALPADKVMAPHDLPVDIVVTPTRVINVEERLSKPTAGILWDRVDTQSFNDIPILKQFKDTPFDLLP